MTDRTVDVNIYNEDGDKAVSVVTDGSTERLAVSNKVTTASSGTYSAVSVTSTATQIFASDSTRTSIQFQNLGDEEIFWGYDNSVTTSNGTRLKTGEVQSLEGYTGTIYAITASSTSDVRKAEF